MGKLTGESVYLQDSLWGSSVWKLMQQNMNRNTGQ